MRKGNRYHVTFDQHEDLVVVFRFRLTCKAAREVFRAKEHGILPDFIWPVQPAQNAYSEQFNRPCREEVLEL